MTHSVPESPSFSSSLLFASLLTHGILLGEEGGCVLGEQEDEKLSEVLTIGEAAKLWGMTVSGLKTVFQRGGFPPGTYRRASNTWLVLKGAMVEKYGPPPGEAAGGVPLRDVLRSLEFRNVHEVLALRDRLPEGAVFKIGRTWYCDPEKLRRALEGAPGTPPPPAL
jgi:hypothetical protein